jgi:hypothetical protein
MVTGVAGEPALDLRGLVGPVVVHHDVDGHGRGELAIHLFRELEKVLRAMATLA